MEQTDQTVPCRICALNGVDRQVKRTGMSPHLRAHTKEGWSRKKYIARWAREGAADDFQDFIPNYEQKKRQEENLAKGRAKIQTAAQVSDEALEFADNPDLEGLTEDERKSYDDFYSMILQAVDRDEVQMPMISSLAVDVIVQKRLRRLQLRQTKSNKFTEAKGLEEALEKTEKRIQSAMKSLCLTREMLLKTREQWKSTAAGLISGYLDEIERQSVESLDAMMIDEKRVLARMQPRVEKFLLVHAKDLEPEKIEEEEENGSLGAEFSLESALKRAGI